MNGYTELFTPSDLTLFRITISNVTENVSTRLRVKASFVLLCNRLNASELISNRHSSTPQLFYPYLQILVLSARLLNLMTLT